MALKRIAPIVLSVLAVVSGAFATAQAPDILLYKGEKKDLFSNPHRSCFTLATEAGTLVIDPYED